MAVSCVNHIEICDDIIPRLQLFYWEVYFVFIEKKKNQTSSISKADVCICLKNKVSRFFQMKMVEVASIKKLPWNFQK